MTWLLLSALFTGCSGKNDVGVDWQFTKGTQAYKTLDPVVEPVPTSLACEEEYVIRTSHASMVESCDPFAIDGGGNPVCKAAVKKAYEAVGDTRCPEPPPVNCPLRTRADWRGWSCAEKPELKGVFANCAVEVWVSCSQG